MVEVLRHRAQSHGDFPVYCLDGADGESETIDFASLERSARAIAVELQSRGAQGPVVLLYPPNSSAFVRGLFGCFFCGVPAVPLMYSHRKHDVARVCAVARDAGAEVILCAKRESASLQGSLAGQLPPGVGWLETDAVDESQAEHWHPPDLEGSSIAHIQYTSGSTSVPKGVIVTHGNVLHNVEYIDRDFRHDAESVAVTWLPHFHDMGLVYGILSPAIIGFRGVLLRPADFVRNPLLWLSNISKYRASHSGGPNFAFELCARRLAAAHQLELQLASWRVAFLGAEMIRPTTLDRFAAAAAPYGFRPKAYYPAYGLAEATLKVTGNALANPLYQSFSRRQLSETMVEEAQPGAADEVRLVSCGSAAEDVEIAIVDSNSNEVGPGRVGEVWVSGLSVAAGYWRQEEETRATFAHCLKDKGKQFLRTGDLGFIHKGRLFIVGRLKELIIIRGINHYPGDLESAAENSHPLLGSYITAAFSVDTGESEQLVLMQEVNRHLPQERYAEVLRAIRDTLAADFGVVADDICLVRKGVLPRTSSGKVRRNKCKALYEQGQLSMLTSLKALHEEVDETVLEKSAAVSEDNNTEWLRSELLEEVRTITAMRLPAIGANHSLAAANFDSLELTQLQGAIERRYRLRLTMQELLGHRSIADLSAHIARALERGQPESKGPGLEMEAELLPAGSVPATDNEQRLWLLDTIHPNCPAHRIVFGIAIEGPLELHILERALSTVMQENPSLGSAFAFENGVLRKKAGPATAQSILELLDRTASGEDRSVEIEELAHQLSRRPVDLKGSLVLFGLMRFSAQEHCLVVCIHHIAFDAMSAEVFVRSISSAYSSLAEPRPADSAPPHLQSNSRCASRTTWTASDLEFWKQFLHGAADAAQLPCEVQRVSWTGSEALLRPLNLPPDLLAMLSQAAQSRSATRFMVLVAAWVESLTVWTRSRSVTFCTPVSGRGHSEGFSRMGSFAYPIVLHFDISNCRHFEQLLQLVKERLTTALSHQQVPFGEIIRALKPSKRLHRLPFFDVMFNYFRRCTPSHLRAGGLDWQLKLLDTGAAESLVSILFVESQEGELTATLKYPKGCFAEGTVSELVALFEARLRALAAPICIESDLVLRETHAC